jgi:hypothetical protein
MSSAAVDQVIVFAAEPQVLFDRILVGPVQTFDSALLEIGKIGLPRL